jgi:hypothetical protein
LSAHCGYDPFTSLLKKAANEEQCPEAFLEVASNIVGEPMSTFSVSCRTFGLDFYVSVQASYDGALATTD